MWHVIELTAHGHSIPCSSRAMDAPRSHELALAKQQCEAEMKKDIDKMLGRMADCDTVHVGHHDISELIKRIEPHLLIKTLALIFVSHPPIHKPS